MRKLYIAAACVLAATNASAFDLSLKDCREMALQSDESVRIAGNNVDGAGIDRGVAYTAYLPKLAGSANVLYYAPDSKMMDMMELQLRGTYMAGINLQQPIYAGGKIVTANKMAAIGEEAAREQLRAARMDVIAEAEKSYWTYVAVLAKVDMMVSYLALMDSVYTTTQYAVETGMAARPALLRVETRRSEIVYRLNQARSGADLCRMALCRAIGVADTVQIVPTEPVGDMFDLPKAGIDVADRPEVRLLEKNVAIKRHEVTMARADFLPTVGVQLGWNAYGDIKTKSWVDDGTGNYMPYTTNTNANGFMGILSVQVPLFHWGEGVKKVKRAKIDVENASLSLERNKRLMELEANQYYSKLLTGINLIRFADDAMREADENLRIMKEQYEVGLNTLTDLLEAQSQWHSSYSNVIEARTQFRIDYIDYLRSVGQLE